ncbi:hypothetical protein [Streptomyces sp. NPDC091217]|uniref:hypothetical protein n=1 Tax=Streptomyces sp. NPDC091217 TaxID=3365975 RepID=UPI00382AF112
MAMHGLTFNEPNLGSKVAKALNPRRRLHWPARLVAPERGVTLEGIDLRTAFLLSLVAVVGYIAYQNPALGTSLAVALAFGLFADHFLRRH